MITHSQKYETEDSTMIALLKSHQLKTAPKIFTTLSEILALPKVLHELVKYKNQVKQVKKEPWNAELVYLHSDIG